MHPFVDGNGRVAYIMMNVELVTATLWPDLETLRRGGKLPYLYRPDGGR
ncbi:hypothetical protein C1T17_08620 [Sphingobium sp. SCG-1]|nr:hypothetical protein C1T17_08620 [Sphingobium sp. SCG-1]